MRTVMTDDIVREFIERLEREGNSKDYVDGALEGISYTVELLQSLKMLESNREKYIRQEHHVSNKIAR